MFVGNSKFFEFLALKYQLKINSNKKLIKYIKYKNEVDC